MDQMTYEQFLREIGRLEEVENAYRDEVDQWEEDSYWYDEEFEEFWEGD